MKQIVQGILKGYRFLVSPLFGKSCRFHPSCSAYTQEAVEKYGAFRGLALGLKRICRCHPYYNGDFHDPVP